jgi:acyl-CoA synthetase (AMP-forming)/AMP-acid ligase II
MGKLDEKGNLWITGRCKDMIIRGGENIAPVAVERALMNIDGITEAVVFGVPHADLGEEVMAVVVVDRDLEPVDLQAQLRDKVSSFAIPSRWRVQRDPLPTNHTGKVDKNVISAEVKAEMARASEKVA